MIQVFISSVQSEFAAERKALCEYIRRDPQNIADNEVDMGIIAKSDPQSDPQNDPQNIVSVRCRSLLETIVSRPTVSKEELARFNYQVGDTEGVVNFPLMIDNIKMAVLITERQGVIRFSFRSKGDFSVHEFAKEHFNGGGHTNAAGGTLDCSIEQAIKQFLDVLPQYKALLNKC